MSSDIFTCFKYSQVASRRNKNLANKTMRLVISRNHDGGVS